MTMLPGERLRQRRLELNLHQSEIPGFNAKTISAYERGARKIPWHVAGVLAQALGLPPDAFMDTIAPRAGHALREAAWEAFQRGNRAEAFELAMKYSRWARGTDDPLLMQAEQEFVEELTRAMEPSDILEGRLREWTPADLNALFHVGRYLHPVSTGMLWLASDRLLKITVPGSEDYYKAVRNRGRLCLLTGVFEGATHWWRVALGDTGHFDRHLQTRWSLADVQSYLGTEDGTDVLLADTERHAVRSPLAWRMYWETRTQWHWRRRDWKGLEDALDAADRTFRQDWIPNNRYVLEGARAMSMWQKTGKRDALTTLRQLLLSDDPDNVGGVDLGVRLRQDWLWIVREAMPEQAPLEWGATIAHWESMGQCGWAQWFAQYLTELPAFLPLSTRRQLQAVLEHDPVKDPLVRTVDSATVPTR